MKCFIVFVVVLMSGNVFAQTAQTGGARWTGGVEIGITKTVKSSSLGVTPTEPLFGISGALNFYIREKGVTDAMITYFADVTTYPAAMSSNVGMMLKAKSGILYGGMGFVYSVEDDLDFWGLCSSIGLRGRGIYIEGRGVAPRHGYAPTLYIGVGGYF